MKYELTTVLDGEATAAKKKAFEERLEKSVLALEGKISESKDWGKKDLSYKIKKSETGLFQHFLLDMPESGAKGLVGKLTPDEEVIRFLLVKAPKVKAKRVVEKK